ncbi:MAG: hypothetical protein IT544_05380 [Rhodobacteraceae bacterium]|nr:hypothetical protein [Paracoccaceae bacterium]
MDPKPDDAKAGTPPRSTAKLSREVRLKAALKANIARRKAQAIVKGKHGATVRDGEGRTE